MDWSLLAGFAAMVVVLEISPGPNFLLITRSVPTFGVKGALANFAGFACSYMLHGALAIYGISAILAAEPILILAIQLGGACYLLYLGIRSLVQQGWLSSSMQWIVQSFAMHFAPVASSLAVGSNTTSIGSTVSLATSDLRSDKFIDIVLDDECGSRDIGGLFRCFREGLLTSVLNPKISLFYMAAFPQLISASTDAMAASFLLVFIHIIISACWVILVALVLLYTLRKSNNQCFINKLNGISGVALIGLSMAFFTSASHLI